MIRFKNLDGDEFGEDGLLLVLPLLSSGFCMLLVRFMSIRSIHSTHRHQSHEVHVCQNTSSSHPINRTAMQLIVIDVPFSFHQQQKKKRKEIQKKFKAQINAEKYLLLC